MNIKTPFLFILLTFTCYSTQVIGQESVKKQAKNVIYVNAGSFGLWFTASANYERHIFSTDKKFFVNYYARASGGAFATWGSDGPFGSLSMQAVFGPKKSHLELGAGLGAMFDKSNYEIGVSNSNYPYPGSTTAPTRLEMTDFVPALLVGYRYQKPTSGFVFRTGVGFPDGAYLSFGVAF